MYEKNFLSLFDSLIRLNPDSNKKNLNSSNNSDGIIESVVNSIKNYHNNANKYGNIINNKNYKYKLVDSDNKLLKYSLNRLVVGISSSNNNSRTNFALCLQKLLIHFDNFINYNGLLDLYFDVYTVNNSTLNKEIKYIYLGRLEVLLSFYKSRFFTKFKVCLYLLIKLNQDDELLLRVIKTVWEVYDYKTYLQDSSLILLMLILSDLDKLNDNVLKVLQDDIKKRFGVSRSLEMFIYARFGLSIGGNDIFDQVKLDNNYPVVGSYIYSFLYYIRSSNMTDTSRDKDVSKDTMSSSKDYDLDTTGRSNVKRGRVELFGNLVNVINYGLDCGSMNDVKMNMILVMLIIRHVNDYYLLLRLFSNFNFFIKTLIKYYRYSNTSHIKSFVNNYLVCLSNVFKKDLFYRTEVSDHHNVVSVVDNDLFQNLVGSESSVCEIDKNVNVDVRVYVDVYNKLVNEFLCRVYYNVSNNTNTVNSNTENSSSSTTKDNNNNKLEDDLRYNLLVKLSEYTNIYKNIAVFDRLIKGVVQYYGNKGGLLVLFNNLVDSLSTSNQHQYDDVNVIDYNDYYCNKLRYFLYLIKLVITNSNYSLLGNYLNFLTSKFRNSSTTKDNDRYNDLFKELGMSLYLELLTKYLSNLLNNYDKINKYNCSILYDNFSILKQCYSSNRNDDEFSEVVDRFLGLLDGISVGGKDNKLQDKDNISNKDEESKNKDSKDKGVVKFVVNVYLMMLYLYSSSEVDELIVYYFNSLYDYFVVDSKKGFVEEDWREKFDLLFKVVVYYSLKETDLSSTNTHSNSKTEGSKDTNSNSNVSRDNVDGTRVSEYKLFNSVNKLVWRMLIDKFDHDAWNMVLEITVGEGVENEDFIRFRRMELGMVGSDESEEDDEHDSDVDQESVESDEEEDQEESDEELELEEEMENQKMDVDQLSDEEEEDEDNENVGNGEEEEDGGNSQEEENELSEDEEKGELDDQPSEEEDVDEDNDDIVLDNYTEILNELTTHGVKRMRPSRSKVGNDRDNGKLVCYGLLLDMLNSCGSKGLDFSCCGLVGLGDLVNLVSDYIRLKNNIVHKFIVKLHQLYGSLSGNAGSNLKDFKNCNIHKTISTTNKVNATDTNNTTNVVSVDTGSTTNVDSNNVDVQEQLVKVVNMSLFNRKLKNVAYQMVGIVNGVVGSEVGTMVVNYVCYSSLTRRTNFSTEQLCKLFYSEVNNNSNRFKNRNRCLLNLFKMLEIENKYMNKPLVKSQILVLHSYLVTNNNYYEVFDSDFISKKDNEQLVERFGSDFVKYVSRSSVMKDLKVLLEMVKELGTVGINTDNNKNKNENDDGNKNKNSKGSEDKEKESNKNKDMNLRNKQYVKGVVRCLNSLVKCVKSNCSTKLNGQSFGDSSTTNVVVDSKDTTTNVDVDSNSDVEKVLGEIAENVKLIKDKKIKNNMKLLVRIDVGSSSSDLEQYVDK